MPELKKLECITVVPAEGGYVIMVEWYSEEEGETLKMVIATRTADAAEIVTAALNEARG